METLYKQRLACSEIWIEKDKILQESWRARCDQQAEGSSWIHGHGKPIETLAHTLGCTQSHRKSWDNKYSTVFFAWLQCAFMQHDDAKHLRINNQICCQMWRIAIQCGFPPVVAESSTRMRHLVDTLSLTDCFCSYYWRYSPAQKVHSNNIFERKKSILSPSNPSQSAMRIFGVSLEAVPWIYVPCALP